MEEWTHWQNPSSPPPHNPPFLPCASPVQYRGRFYSYFWALSASLPVFLKAQILRTVFNSETYSVSPPGACIFAVPGMPPISWSKLSQRLEASQPSVLSPGILLLPAWAPVMGKVLINQSHCCLDSSPDNIALCAAEVTSPVLFPMWCNGTSSLPATPWSQLPKCHVCREWQSFCHQGKSKILARQSPHTVSHYWSGKGKADRPVLQTQALSKGTQRLAMLPSGSLSSSVLLPPPNWITLGRFLNICRLPHRVGINLGPVHSRAMVRTCKPLAQWPGQIQWWWVLSRSHWWQCVFSWHHNTGLKVLLLPPAKYLNLEYHSTSGAVCF